MISTKFIKKTGDKRLLIISGNGLSMDSGFDLYDIPDNFQINDVCNIASLGTKYHVVHSYYNTLRVKLKDIEPNEMHYYIKSLQDEYGDNFLHMTSNVDDLYTRIGGTELKLHGNIKEVIENYTADGSEIEIKELGYEPYIPCSGIFSKPGVTLIGEFHSYFYGYKTPIYEERNEILKSLNENDTVVVIGSSDSVLKWSHLINDKCYTVLINIRKNENDHRFNERIYKSCSKSVLDLSGIISKRMV